jgi:glycoside/pentoside/hexuronide:cation symporter, GPH family
MNATSQKVSVIEKIGYSLGDLAANLIFQTLMTFLAFFYTDVYRIPPATASAIIFAGGMIGAFFNPVMGIIADRTSTRWGKFRPWILWTAVPFGVIAILAFSTPDFSPGGKVAYALITYILLVIVYSANNLPYASLSGVFDRQHGRTEQYFKLSLCGCYDCPVYCAGPVVTPGTYFG